MKMILSCNKWLPVSVVLLTIASHVLADLPNEMDVLHAPIPEKANFETRFRDAAFGQRTNVLGETQLHKDRKSAEAGAGDATAQFHLALYYATGHGLPLDPPTAVEWCRKAAQQGLAPAQNYLGLMLENGFGVPTNAVEAVQWYRKAADQGNAEGLYNLALSYAYGQGVQQDYRKALVL